MIALGGNMNLNDQLLLEYGSLKDFAKAIGYTPTSVYRWMDKGFPIDKIRKIEIATEGKVTREMLRPDLFKRD
jgi:DNA-binding transcriptional regulator YdaS (Cro superfamily)